ncbi:hypothetical protein C8Q75DRAFT_786783 [Abortiporus biennis]|nr:hypothetical protein C8Q75DRAFT_786783 [Abortiporus biennis]
MRNSYGVSSDSNVFRHHGRSMSDCFHHMIESNNTTFSPPFVVTSSLSDDVRPLSSTRKRCKTSSQSRLDRTIPPLQIISRYLHGDKTSIPTPTNNALKTQLFSTSVTQTRRILPCEDRFDDPTILVTSSSSIFPFKHGRRQYGIPDTFGNCFSSPEYTHHQSSSSLMEVSNFDSIDQISHSSMSLTEHGYFHHITYGSAAQNVYPSLLEDTQSHMTGSDMYYSPSPSLEALPASPWNHPICRTSTKDRLRHHKTSNSTSSSASDQRQMYRQFPSPPDLIETTSNETCYDGGEDNPYAIVSMEEAVKFIEEAVASYIVPMDPS